jgi:hypothetical protein
MNLEQPSTAAPKVPNRHPEPGAQTLVDESLRMFLEFNFCDSAGATYLTECITNNGNLRGQLIKPNATQTFTQAYTYDDLNRLRYFSETGGGATVTEDYRYDPFGNMWWKKEAGDMTVGRPHCNHDDTCALADSTNNRLAMTNVSYASDGTVRAYP